MSEQNPVIEGRPAGWYLDVSMRDTRRYWDGTRWTENVAPIHEDLTRPTEAVASGVLKAAFLIALVPIGLGILAVGLTLLADSDLNGGVLAGLVLIAVALVCAVVALRPAAASKRRRQPRQPWSWWELAIVAVLGGALLLGLIGTAQQQQRDAKLDRIACESGEDLYGAAC